MAKAARISDPYQDLMALPGHQVGEILGGVLHASPRPASRHARASSSLGGELHGPFDLGRGGPGGWWILDEPELHLGADVLVPDLAGWRRDRLPALPDAAFFTDPPDWVCEVLSPSTARLDRVEKLPVYTAFEVQHAWLIDPVARTLEVLRSESGRWVLLGAWGGDAVVHAEPFEAHALELAGLWL